MSDVFVRPDVMEFLQALAATPAPRLPELGPDGARDAMRQMGEMFDLPAGELAVNREIRWPTAGGTMLKLRLIDVRAERGPTPVVLFLHGGGFVIGDVDIYQGSCAEISRQLDMPVAAVDYRLAPEHPWPAAPDDCEAAARWVATSPAELGLQVSGLIIAGDSAGGGLTLVTTLALRDTPADVPVLAQWALYPVTDLADAHPSHESLSAGYLVETADLRWFYELYAADARHWRASPLLAEQAGMPPSLVVTCGLDPLRDEGRAYAAATVRAGVPTIFLEAEGMIHGFMSFRRVIPSAVDDLKACTTALQALLAAAGRRG